ncbi:solute carrier family 25 member 40 isoform X2 [Ailuropoda melanoleuca]|uniref:solute carrier family 25 member 40 isoform X2 n=1 Tax=Ailuropoda melanoleuca TaxID=9646 RepID=UPI001494141A|nr:solute carrier family 25 member 40 isoform X2 [Ailuropoda melanoleuca]
MLTAHYRGFGSPQVRFPCGNEGHCVFICHLAFFTLSCGNWGSGNSYKNADTLAAAVADAFLKIIRNEGIKSLWSGLPPTLMMAVPATVIYFTCYDQLSALLRSKLGENESRIPIIAGIVARFGAVTVISPLELIRTKMQSKKFSYKELHRFVSKTVSEDGWISLWRGWAPTILRDVPFSAMYWYNYEVLKKWLCAKSGLYEPTFMINFTSGALSGSFAAVATLPFDVVKTQKQTQLWIYESHKISMPLPMSTWTIMKSIVAKNGFAGLFTGLIPRLIKIAPACAVMISTYEFGKAFFQKQNARRQQY